MTGDALVAFAAAVFGGGSVAAWFKWRTDSPKALQEATRLVVETLTADYARLAAEVQRVNERVVLLEREIVRLGGDPHTIGVTFASV